MRIRTSPVAVTVTSSTMLDEDTEGPIEKVLLLTGTASSALGSLLYGLEQMHADGTLPALGVSTNQYEALLDLRKSAFGL